MFRTLDALPSGALDAQLATLRTNIDDLTRSLDDEYGANNEAVHRAEQLSAAIQRLEWRLKGSGFGAGLRPLAAEPVTNISVNEERTLMLFLIQAIVDLTTRSRLRRESERRLHFATDRFQLHIRDIDVRLQDVNGPRGGIDKRCLVSARLRRGGTVEIEETSSSFVGAIRAAAKRLRRQLARRLGGKLRRKNFRRDRTPFRLPWGVA
jgi:ribosome-associated translation inhibitor RaiA